MDVTDAVADCEASIIFPQAQNGTHFQKALMLALMGIDELPANPGKREIAEDCSPRRHRIRRRHQLVPLIRAPAFVAGTTS